MFKFLRPVTAFFGYVVLSLLHWKIVKQIFESKKLRELLVRKGVFDSKYFNIIFPLLSEKTTTEYLSIIESNSEGTPLKKHIFDRITESIVSSQYNYSSRYVR